MKSLKKQFTTVFLGLILLGGSVTFALANVPPPFCSYIREGTVSCTLIDEADSPTTGKHYCVYSC